MLTEPKMLDAALEERVLVLAPTGRDATTTTIVLQEDGIAAEVCLDMIALCQAIEAGAGATVIAEEAFTPEMLALLARTLTDQPHWSDFPLVILASTGRGSLASQTVLAELGAITKAAVLERPLRKATLISAVRVALRARRRQFEMRDHLAERERMERQREDMLQHQQRIAETLQRCLLETPPPDAFPNLEIGTQYVPASAEAMVGGDFFDVFSVEERVALVVGDVVGKGLTAASQMAEIKFALRAIVRQNPNPSRALAQLNRYVLSADQTRWGSDQTLVAVALAIIDPRNGEVTLSVAGAEAPVLLRRGHGAETISTNAMAIGVSDKASYRSVELALEKDDLLFLVTDGITEARRGHEFFGAEGFTEAVSQAHFDATPNEIGSFVIDQARDFANGRFRDDVCLLVARWQGITVLDTQTELSDLETDARVTQVGLNQQFILKLEERIRPNVDPDIILWETLNALGLHLGVSSCFYADIDIDKSLMTVHRDYCHDIPSHVGTYSLEQFSSDNIEKLLIGETVAVDDTMLDRRTADRYDTAYAPLDIRTFISVPLIKDSLCVGLLSVQDINPRRWTRDDLDLMRQVAAQTWLVWDNARLYRRSQQNAQRQRTFLRDVLMSVTEGHLCLCDGPNDLPKPLKRFRGPISVDAMTGLAAARRATADACRKVGLANDRLYDLETAVSEAAMNAALHAGGGSVDVFIDLDGIVQIRIEDHGAGITDENLPRAALARGYSTADTLGHGMKMMLQTADRVYLLTGATGTCVVLEQYRSPIEHAW